MGERRHPMMKTPPAAAAAVAAFVALAGASAFAQAPAAPPLACQSAEHRQFDFWIGEWEVFLPDGWFHHVESKAAALSINFPFPPPST